MTIAPSAPVMPNQKAQLLIIGGGGCGLCAALAAREAGIDVLVVDRDETPTGNTALSIGMIPAAGTRFQRAKGIEDSPELFAADIMAKTKGQTDPAMVRAVTEESARTVEWLVDTYGLTLDVIDDILFPGHSRHRYHIPHSRTGAELQSSLLSAARHAGVRFMTPAVAEELHADSDHNIEAVSVRRANGRLDIVECDALVLACDGFGANRQLVERYIPEIAGAAYCGRETTRGDTVRWGTTLGAAMADLGAYQGHAVAYEGNLQLTWSLIIYGGFHVNQDGARFANEMRGYSEHAAEIIRQKDQIAWAIFDARCEAPALTFEEYRNISRLDLIRCASSIPELAATAGLPYAALARTIEEVADCAAGRIKDRFGRVFTDALALKPPYLAIKVKAALYHTQGGLVVDPTARVRHKDGGLFPNLFAGGGAARGFSGPSSWGYLGGNGLLSAIVLGRIAGMNAARLLAGDSDNL